MRRCNWSRTAETVTDRSTLGRGPDAAVEPLGRLHSGELDFLGQPRAAESAGDGADGRPVLVDGQRDDHDRCGEAPQQGHRGPQLVDALHS